VEWGLEREYIKAEQLYLDKAGLKNAQRFEAGQSDLDKIGSFCPNLPLFSGAQ